MFTGIIEEVGSIAMIRDVDGGKRIGVNCTWAAELQVDESVAVSGVCLTVVSRDANQFEAVVVEETLERSSLGSLSAGDSVNLERAMPFNGRIDGHIVQGHVDGTGIVTEIHRRGSSHEVWIQIPTEDLRLVIPKGSVTLDGISLTVADIQKDRLKVAIIPHTYENTTVRSWCSGSPINIEYDMIGKYVIRYLQGFEDDEKVSGISREWLRSRGF